ncbi:hypothetical protein VTK26DRAFT_2519 [Humicola hyalothermophila]
MPLSLEAPVLQVDANVIHKVDTTNPANLFSMWTVFARCRDSVAQGRRLENLSWRLWNRETFCCEDADTMVSPCALSKPRDIRYPSEVVADDLPQLSGSVDSVADEEAVDFSTESAPVDIVRPKIQRQDSCASSRSRGRERHITSDELEKMVVSIMEAKVPLDAPLPSIPRSPATEEEPACARKPERTGSTTTNLSREMSENPSTESLDSERAQEAAPTPTRTVVTRGFSPAQVPASLITAQVPNRPSPGGIPEPTAAPAPKIILPKKQQAKFALGGSSGSDDGSFESREIETRKQPAPQQRPMKMFQVGGSSESDGSPRNPQLMQLNGQKKTASFNKQVVTQTFTSSAISDTETDYDESAIDDDEDEDWEEDEADDTGDSSGEEKIHFKRVDSSANLTSRRSLITLMLAANNDRAHRLGNQASQSTPAIPRAARAVLNGPSLVASPNDSDEAPLMMKRTSNRAPPMRPINEIPRSAAQPINVVSNGMHYQAALSPRTTRRNMLATELTESLRRNLLRERSQKSSTANAVLKRRHTSTDVANLKQYPEKPFMKNKEEGSDATSWDQYFKNPFAGYQAQAW